MKGPNSNLFYTLCFLAPKGVLLGVFFGIPLALVATFSSTAIVIVCLPYNLFLAMRTLYTTTFLGPNVRILLLLFLPFITVVYPIAFFSVALVLSIAYDVLGMTASVFMDCEEEGCMGLAVFYKDTWDAVIQVYKHVYSDASETAPQLCRIPQNWNGHVYEIPLHKLGIGILLLVYGSAIGALVVPLISFLKLPFGLYHANKGYLRLCWRQPCYWVFVEFLGFVFLNILVLPLATLVIPPLYGVFIGVSCASEALRVNDMKEGFRESFRILREFDVATTDLLIFGGDDRWNGEHWSFIPLVSPPILLESNANRDACDMEAKTMEAIFGRFAAECKHVTDEVVHQEEWIQRSDLEDLSPFVFLGIPGIALFDIVRQSATLVPGKDELVCQCSLNDETSIARIRGDDVPKTNGVAKVFWPKLMRAKRDLEQTENLTDDEVEWIRCRLLVNGAERMTPKAQEMLARVENNARLGLIFASFYSLAIDISRLSRTSQIISELVKPEPKDIV